MNHLLDSDPASAIDSDLSIVDLLSGFSSEEGSDKSFRMKNPVSSPHLGEDSFLAGAERSS